MRMNLTEEEVRVLGCLMEKELATPESYPLSINALTSACNQKSNRDPVLSLSEGDVQRTLETLGTKGLARLTATGGRVARYRHSVAEKLRLESPERAVLAELMLRGPQTAAELRSRGERMTPLTDIEGVLTTLQQHGPPLITLLPRQAGRKEQRYAQLFSGMPEMADVDEVPEAADLAEGAEFPVVRRAPLASPQKVERQERLEKISRDVTEIRSEIVELRQMVQELVALFQ
ncbi:YceH family protein [Geomonas sp. RF6]|uniref:YceH family protein n=1 Tax=Geomonas sp. RF6 TaxID=2897342 RepID=UPI001E3AD810|nr:YceH family protein [Geomonas sp. RF6]UFS71986.1 YceH family protein [Geomonas sp. RF6]